MKQNGIVLDHDVADSITVLNLLQLRENIQEELKKIADNKLHNDDIGVLYKTAVSIGIVLEYFGHEDGKR